MYVGGKEEPTAGAWSKIASMVGVRGAMIRCGRSRSGGGSVGADGPCRSGEAECRSWDRFVGARYPEWLEEVWRQRSALASEARGGEDPRPRPPRRGDRDREEGRQRDESTVGREVVTNSSAG